MKWFKCIEYKIGLEFYQIIVFVGALIGLVWTDKRYKQGQENLKQNNYFKGLDNLTDKDSLKVEIGVEQLISLSKTNSKYNQGIKLAFIKRLKKPLERENNTPHFSFGQYIIDWLSKNFEGKKLDLKGCNLDWHEFVIKPNFAIFKNKDNILGKLSFRNADLREADLKETVFAINSLNTLSPKQLDSAKNVTKIKIYIHSKDKSYSLKEFVEMNPSDIINDKDFQLKDEIFDYLVKLSKQN